MVVKVKLWPRDLSGTRREGGVGVVWDEVVGLQAWTQFSTAGRSVTPVFGPSVTLLRE